MGIPASPESVPEFSTEKPPQSEGATRAGAAPGDRTQPNPATPTPVGLLPDRERPADRHDEAAGRDVTAVFAR